MTRGTTVMVQARLGQGEEMATFLHRDADQVLVEYPLRARIAGRMLSDDGGPAVYRRPIHPWEWVAADRVSAL